MVFCLYITLSTFARRKSNVAGFTRWNFPNSAGSCRSSSTKFSKAPCSSCRPMCGFIHTLPTLWGWALWRLRRLLRTNAYAAMHKMACLESAAIFSVFEKMTQGGRTVCYWYTKYPPGSLSASTVVSRCVCSQLLSRSVCGHSTIVAWCVRVIRQSSSSSPQTTIVGPTKVAWCVPSFR